MDENALSYQIVNAAIEVHRTLGGPGLDVMVNDLVLVECKAVREYNRIFEAQLMTYLRLMNMRLGLVINFGEKYVSDGIHRVPNRMPD